MGPCSGEHQELRIRQHTVIYCRYQMVLARSGPGQVLVRLNFSENLLTIDDASRCELDETP